MIVQIEDAIVAYLQAQIGAATRIAVQKGFEGVPQPAIYIATDAGRFQKTSNHAYRQTNTIFIDLIFKGLKTEAARRAGLYGILETVIGSLAFQTLGLEIHPLEPKSFRNVTTEEMLRDGLIAYSLEYETWYQVSKMVPDDAPDLLSLSFQYFLHGAADAGYGDQADGVGGYGSGVSDLEATPDAEDLIVVQGGNPNAGAGDTNFGEGGFGTGGPSD